MQSHKITREEFDRLNLVPFGKIHPVRALITSLNVGEIVRIARSEFRWKHHTPNLFVREISKRKKRKFTFFKEANDNGWVVERVK